MHRAKSRRRFSSAHAIAIAALFFALGGGAYAAVQSPPANSVGTKQLQKEAVTPPKISKSFYRRLKRELKKLFRTHLPGRETGPAGPAGKPGEPGPPGPSDTYIGGAAGGGLTGSYTQVAATSVPAGEYLIEAKTTVFSPTENTAGAASCLIEPEIGGAAWDGGTAAFPAIAGVSSSSVITLAGADSFTGTTSIVLACRSTAGTVSFDDARVWATKVGSLHGLPVPID
ncbi:MAG TPA: hypothetical protein VFX44_06425 [Solirubrobacterales bacterium]|nr:hypothetical protein [Solirubrobacterales bacterium]